MPKFDPTIHHRRSIRLKGYDYSQAGLYFVTVCAQNMKCIFGDVVDEKMVLNEAGQMVECEWLALKERFGIVLHEYVVMPNHFHGILEIVGATVGATLVVALNDDTPIKNDENTSVSDGRATTRVAPTVAQNDNTAINNEENTCVLEGGRPRGSPLRSPTWSAHSNQS